MTVETTTRRVIANGNGSATSFSFAPMVIYQSSDLVVVKRDTAGVETVLAEGSGASNYIVVVSSYPGTGAITFPASGTTKLASGEKLAIVPHIPIKQETDLDNQGGYFADIQELQFDKLVHIDQQQQEQLERALKINVSDTAVLSTDPGKLTANYVLAVNADATGFLWSASLPGNVTVSAFMATVLDDADAAAARTTLGVTALNAALTAINALTPAADRLPYYTGASAAALATFTSFGRSLVDDADAAAGRTTLGFSQTLVQRVYAAPVTAASAISATPIPVDNTIPQISEGTEIITATITPKSASNRLRVTYTGSLGCNSGAAGRVGVVALFRDATADALRAGVIRTVIAGPHYWEFVLVHEFVAGSTNATTLSIRLGNPSSDTLDVNHAVVGGVNMQTLCVEEFTP